ncbi:glycerophosphoryl diester phosphodiesterase [Armatimonas rosea]|uniref:Glycerophosphoryl diester phosphodiesterase n=1 Tax=Armatimonas rosea TaxID=685828 RepID=A0A7W9SSS7_ARMRO|nr:glycerophosphoryl diester phosphodiesterase [Armatimonas rosea]MBB6051504.1 hypothetical protein [Armatimonas rosea]
METWELRDALCRLAWKKTDAGWALTTVDVEGRALGKPAGQYTILFSETKPDPKEVAANTAGEAFRFLLSVRDKNTFSGECPAATVQAEWRLSPETPGEVRVALTLTAKRRGYFSLASPALTTLTTRELTWGMIPGHWQGTALQPDLDLAYTYGQGIPSKPVLARERTTTTLLALLSTRAATLAAVAEPGTGRDPWERDALTHNTWKLGLSLMERAGALTPTLYAPVLGEAGSLLEPGQTATLNLRFVLRPGGWEPVYTHVVEKIYAFSAALALKKQTLSLTDRLAKMHTYVSDPVASRWQEDTARGLRVGAQSYLGGVKGATKGEAMKNSDLGALWMLAKVTGDPVLERERLPLVRNFKLAQQETTGGFFQGAVLGQYWLQTQKKFVEEWGPYVEPMALTYYTLIDMGNILLFSPQDTELRGRLKLGAETLLRWQKPDGSFDVAYDRESHQLSYPKLTDLRPTWYGLYVAWRILGERRYLEAARRGADWFVKSAVERGHYLGVCGDADFVMDFATGQSAQCLLDLYAATGERRYKDAALKAGRLYWTWTYTHPVPTRKKKTVKNLPREDWELTQAGLSMEHGGTHGSANSMGPIQLCSHAGLFVRLYEATHERLFLDMARHAALGRDAFVDPKSGVASYYWKAMNAGPGPYPHHAWWQVGWIMDYLLAEAQLRSEGKVVFPRGFVTPKVGPQQSVGFAPGTVYGKSAHLWMPAGQLASSNPMTEVLAARSDDHKTLFVLVLSDSAAVQSATVTAHGTTLALTLPPYGLVVKEVSL